MFGMNSVPILALLVLAIISCTIEVDAKHNTQKPYERQERYGKGKTYFQADGLPRKDIQCDDVKEVEHMVDDVMGDCLSSRFAPYPIPAPGQNYPKHDPRLCCFQLMKLCNEAKIVKEKCKVLTEFMDWKFWKKLRYLQEDCKKDADIDVSDVYCESQTPNPEAPNTAECQPWLPCSLDDEKGFDISRVYNYTPIDQMPVVPSDPGSGHENPDHSSGPGSGTHNSPSTTDIPAKQVNTGARNTGAHTLTVIVVLAVIPFIHI